MAKAKTIRSETIGKRALRLVEQDGKFFGLADGKRCTEGSDAEAVWASLHDEAGKADPKYFGYKGARSKFLKFFPNGFHSDGFRSQERSYKVAAKEKLDAAAPLTEPKEGNGFGEALLSAYRATNMLSPFEKTKLQDVFRGDDSDAVVRALARFTTDNDAASLSRLATLLKPYDSAKWTVVTYIPYLWRPETHMFLKPEATKDFATRVGHPLASIYQAPLSYEVYASLLDLVAQTEKELADLNPRDHIDIQSFIWVVGKYPEDSEDVYEKPGEGWSPEQISGRMRLESCPVGRQSIYNRVHADRKAGGNPWRYLRRRGKKPNWKGGSHAGRGHIPGRVDISRRPAVVERKKRIGDWEADTIIGKGHSGAMVSLVDRATKYTLLRRVDRKTAEAVCVALIELLGSVATPPHTITSDNGKEFADHTRVSKETGADFFFARPCHSWERGLNEHTNGLIREYFPKATDFRQVSDAEVQAVADRLNARPRKVLG